jgi:hypothetical protein
MRRCLVAAVLGVVVLVPTLGNAQTYFQPTPPPQVTAASAEWQIRGEPIFYAGNFYWPTGPSVFFDGSVMVRSGVHLGVPLYVDTSITPYSIVYVPIGGNVLRPYERRRTGELAGTVGSRTPSFPTERDVELSVASDRADVTAMPFGGPEVDVFPESARPWRAVATGGLLPPGMADGGNTMIERARSRVSAIQSIPQPQSNSGVWLQFNGTRWYSAGDAVRYSSDRFIPIGAHRGFPVYRDVNGNGTEIYVASVKDGPLAPYRR